MRTWRCNFRSVRCFLLSCSEGVAFEFCKWNPLLGTLLSTSVGCAYAASGCLAFAKSLQDSDRHVQITLLLLAALFLGFIAMAACFGLFAMAVLKLAFWDL